MMNTATTWVCKVPASLLCLTVTAVLDPCCTVGVLTGNGAGKDANRMREAQYSGIAGYAHHP